MAGRIRATKCAVKPRHLIAVSALFVLGACDQKNGTTTLEAEKAKLEAERTKLESEKMQLAADKAEAAQAAADAQARKLDAERGRLEEDKAKLAAEQAKLAADKSEKANADRAAKREEMARLDEQKSDLAIAAAKTAEERRRLLDLKERAEAERKAAERATTEARMREEAAKRAQTAAAAPTVALFYDALDAQGDWFDSDRYGYVWQPAVGKRNKDWRPYTDGRWQWTDYGWTWQSNEAFGWAAYHYGRWARLPQLGWVWVPGSEWAPAWVSWRVRGVQYVGWAPLPPEAYSARGYGATVDEYFDIGPWSYVLLELKDFDAPSYAHKFIAAEKHMEMLAATRNVTDISYRNVGGRSMLVCGGPDSVSLASALRELRDDQNAQPIPRMNLMLMNQAASTAAPDVVNAGALMLFAPLLEHKLPATKPKAPREKIAVKEVERGWTGGSPWEETQWRDNLKREARNHEAVEKRVAAPKPAATPAPVKAVVATPKPAPTPAPKPVANPAGNGGKTGNGGRAAQQATPTPRPGALAPAKIEPSSGLKR